MKRKLRPERGPYILPGIGQFAIPTIVTSFLTEHKTSPSPGGALRTAPDCVHTRQPTLSNVRRSLLNEPSEDSRGNRSELICCDTHITVRKRDPHSVRGVSASSNTWTSRYPMVGALASAAAQRAAMDRTATGKRGRSPLRGPGSRQMVPEAFLAISREMFDFVNSPRVDRPEPKAGTMRKSMRRARRGYVQEMVSSKTTSATKVQAWSKR